MSAENIYEYLCGLERAIDEMESIIHDRESQIDDLHLRLANAEMNALAARRESEDFTTKISRDAQRYIEVEVQARLDAAVNDRIDSLIRHERQKFEEELEAFKAQLMADAEAAALSEAAAEPAAPTLATSHAPKFQKSARKSTPPQVDLFSETIIVESNDFAHESAVVEQSPPSAKAPQAAKPASNTQPVQPAQKSAGNHSDWSKTHKVANDASALILADKLDSTIDKVQRLLREAAG
ncbi:MAG: hypothetical protein JNK24_01905 [Alphaproteobacteria bacterium]|nr:hypothetical protein [Alphaproteobacteria bacterium]